MLDSQMPPRELTVNVAHEMAALVRQNNEEQSVDADIILAVFCRMLASDASTPADALALITTARKLFNGVVLPEGSVEDIAQRGALALIMKASECLERVTGERASTFAGYEWH